MTRAPAHARVILGFREGTPPPPTPDLSRDRFALLLLGPAIALTVVAASVGAGARPAQGAAPIAPTAVVGVATYEVPEGATTVARLTAGVARAAGARFKWTVTGGADAGHFALSADGLLRFRTAKDFELPDDSDGDRSYELSVRVGDGLQVESARLVVTVVNVVELTSMRGPARASVAENDYGRVATYAASSEPDREGVRWSLNGPDAAHFTIDAPAGALRLRIAASALGRFPTAADYEDPLDAGADNTYEVTVVASAPGGASASRAVTVTVTDEDEPGSITLSHTRPRVGEPLAATLRDPDAVAGAVSWSWERSAGRNAWIAIKGATAPAYAPTAADAGEHLRVTARYGDRHGTGKALVATLHNVVLADLLSALTASTGDSEAEDSSGDAWAGWRLMRPGFDERTLHYSVGCGDADIMTLTFAAADAASRLAVDGVAYPNPGAGRTVTASLPVDGRSEVVVSLSNGDGGETRYAVHCLHEDLDPFTAQASAGATELLLLASVGTDLLVLDRNGVPRRHIGVAPGEARGYFRFYPDGGNGEYRYSYTTVQDAGSWNSSHVVLDEDLEAVDEVTTVAPLTHTGFHDFRVLESGNYLLMAFEETVRDFSRLTFPDADGEPYGAETRSIDSAIQIVTPAGEALLTWNSYDHLPLEDCTHHWFPPGNPRWAHVNSVGIYDGEIVASFRGCNRILGIDPATGEVNWRLGPTNEDEPGWASPPLDPAPLAIAGDPQGQFCGQHAAQVTPGARLLLYDNGANCSRNPWMGENLVRPDRTYSRALEYQLDFDHHEAVYVRERSLGGTRERIGWFSGHVEELEGGDWLVNWGSEGSPRPEGPPWPAHEVATATQLDPVTGRESLSLHWPSAGGRDIRVTAMPAWALARQPRSLSAAFLSAASSGFHRGAADRPQVVVTLNHPVADFAASSPSLSVEGATVVAVSPRVAAGEPAYSYTVTLLPDGQRPIRFALLAGRPCEAGGVCAADGTPLTDVPPELSIPARRCRP